MTWVTSTINFNLDTGDPKYSDGVCCDLVGNFPMSPQSGHGIISISSRSNTKVGFYTDRSISEIALSPSIGTLSLTAYASYERYIGCPGRIGVSIPWIERNDCEEYVFIFGGAGQSYISGEDQGGGFATFPSVAGIDNPFNAYKVINASASSGPAARYEDSIQYDGYGLIYSGKPFSQPINTTNESDCIFNLSDYGLVGYYGDCRLTSLSLDLTPGEVPIVSLEFKYSIGQNGQLYAWEDDGAQPTGVSFSPSTSTTINTFNSPSLPAGSNPATQGWTGTVVI